MADAAREEGVSLRSVSAYRSYQRQTSTYNRYLSQDRQASVDTYSARPGHSEHQTGLALDINTASIPAHFENTPAFAWLKEHCAQYGFILRYPQGKEGITGYRFEPWHYRYVGLEAAQACMSQGLTFEEYLAQRPEIPSPTKVEI
ncbi:MAG: M15 family metallopeptidase [Lawsonibacter sp.]|nr:M15 family metallopeptidase [Lawsonibacter sp.]